jgi:hypothetical protein
MDATRANNWPAAHSISEWLGIEVTIATNEGRETRRGVEPWRTEPVDGPVSSGLQISQQRVVLDGPIGHLSGYTRMSLLGICGGADKTGSSAIH